MSSQPKFLMFAGPNGSGKSSIFAIGGRFGWIHDRYLNADELQKLLADKWQLDFQELFGVAATQEDWERISYSGTLFRKFESIVDKSAITIRNDKIFVEEGSHLSAIATMISEFVRLRMFEERKSFSMETVMSHHSKVDFLDKCRRAGYFVELVFITTKSPLINVERVKSRVRRGGHSVPKDKIISRYYRTMDLLYSAILASDQASVFDNSLEAPVEIAKWENGYLNLSRKRVPAWVQQYLLDKF